MQKCDFVTILRVGNLTPDLTGEEAMKNLRAFFQQEDGGLLIVPVKELQRMMRENGNNKVPAAIRQHNAKQYTAGLKVFDKARHRVHLNPKSLEDFAPVREDCYPVRDLSAPKGFEFKPAAPNPA